MSEIDRGVALAHEAQALLCNMLRVSAAVEIEEALHILDDIILIFHNTRNNESSSKKENISEKEDPYGRGEYSVAEDW